MLEPKASERVIVLLMAAVQFVNALEFMIVMPLGPDFARELVLDPSKLALIGGAYTGAAALGGILSAFFIERFDRRAALAATMFALVCATAAGGLARDLPSLVMARVFAGLVGGPATALAMTILTDQIPLERRGKAMGTVMAAFSCTSIIGLPAALEIARLGGWRAAFFVVAFLGLLVIAAIMLKLPPMRGHLKDFANSPAQTSALLPLFKRPLVRHSFAMGTCLMLGMAMLMPNISVFVQGNMAFPRSSMSLFYFVGGCVTFVTMGGAGRLVDRFGPLAIATVSSLLLMATLIAWFIIGMPTGAALPLFGLLMCCASLRVLPYQTLLSQVPKPHERARLMSLQSSLQAITATSGAVLSSLLLSQGPNGQLVGMERVAYAVLALSAAVPILMTVVARGVAQQNAQASAEPPRADEIDKAV